VAEFPTIVFFSRHHLLLSCRFTRVTTRINPPPADSSSLPLPGLNVQTPPPDARGGHYSFQPNSSVPSRARASFLESSLPAVHALKVQGSWLIFIDWGFRAIRCVPTRSPLPLSSIFPLAFSGRFFFAFLWRRRRRRSDRRVSGARPTQVLIVILSPFFATTRFSVSLPIPIILLACG